MTSDDPHAPGELKGVGVSNGIAMGRALVLEGQDAAVFRIDRSPEEFDGEVARLRSAMKEAWRQIRGLRDRVRQEAGETYARLFQAQMLILRDRALRRETVALIRRERVNAEWAFRTVVRRYTQVFAQLEEPSLREQGSDIEDVEARVQAILAGARRRHDLSELLEDVVVVSPGLTPSDVANLDRRRVVGLALDGGGPTSHSSIIARARGIPAVVGLGVASTSVRTGDQVVLDGGAGRLLWSLPEEDLADWRSRRSAAERQAQSLAALSTAPSVTRDGVHVILRANVELPEEIEIARRHGAEGIGLYRSELQFLRMAPVLPTEEDYHDICRDLLRLAHPGTVVFRTLDLGGEAGVAPVQTPREPNPVLGLRGIRLSLRQGSALFRAQIRGILRAAQHGPLSILLPMVSGVGELRAARAVIQETADGLRAAGVPFRGDLPVGVMIEIPSAALLADHFAAEADFLSIGTNDLIQYTLATDRGNPGVSYLYEPLHPAVLWLLHRVVTAGEAAHRPVSVCGEMAADPLCAVALLGLGVRELSMSPNALPRLRQVVRGLSLDELAPVLHDALGMTTAAEVRTLLEARLAACLPPDLLPIPEGRIR